MRCEDTTLVDFSLQDIPKLGFCATTGVNISNTAVLSSAFKVVFCIGFNFVKGKYQFAKYIQRNDIGVTKV